MRRYVLLLGAGALTAAAAAASLIKPAAASGPVSLSQTQPVNVFVECVRNGDGSFDAKLGYENGNAAPVIVPVGPSNRFSPAPEDRGQPTVFLSGVHHDALTVAGIPNGASLVWTLTSAGQTRTTTATATFSAKCGAARPIDVFVDCVRNGDGSFDARFGYRSDNPEPVSIPVGPGNGFSPAPEDRGQPTVFLPGVHHDVFTAEGVPSQTVLVWTLAFAGVTETATAIASFATKCPPAAQAPAPERGGKVAVCHRTRSPRKPYRMIRVSGAAVPAHLRHGDVLAAADGSCPGKAAVTAKKAKGKGHGKGRR